MDATAAQIEDAVRAGATMSTHLGNAARASLPRRANCILDQLADDRLTASFIADGIHLPAPFLKVALRAKGVARSVLVTDAVAPAGCEPGRYKLGEQDVELLPDDRVVLAGQTRLAGAALRMHHGVETLMRLGGLSLADAVSLATVNPARAAGIEGRQRGIEQGERADLVEFHCSTGGGIEIEKTYLAGELVHSR
jgi:N-acetylglucosamine-6-phosphate deacetylase